MVIDEEGEISSARDYYAYGDVLQEVTIGEEEKYKFTEKERDSETGLDYFGARYYDSEIGRWTSVDPLADNDPGWSPYNYSRNDPLNKYDPDGRFWHILGGAAIGAVISGGIELASQYQSGKDINWSAVGGMTERAITGENILDPVKMATDAISNGAGGAVANKVTQVISSEAASNITGVVTQKLGSKATEKVTNAAVSSSRSIVKTAVEKTIKKVEEITSDNEKDQR